MEALEDTVGAAPEDPSTRAYRLLHRAFRELQSNHRALAWSSLDSASLVLSDLPPSDLPPDRYAGLIRITLELYRDLLPKAAPIPVDSPLSRLMDALSGQDLPAVEDRSYYREFCLRRLAGTADVPIDCTPEVIESIRYFQTSGREIFSSWLSRSGTYMPMIRHIFREAGLPEDLAYQCMIESGFKPYASSRARAVGLWQFVHHTAQVYGLKHNTWLDERRDPEKSTRAAARHIRHLHERFGDWRLVVAAYNCGQGRLNRAIRKSSTQDFWELKSLPRETRNHVPRFMAAVLISKAPAWFGFGHVVYRDSLAYDTVQVSECVDLRIAAECVDAPYVWIRELNAELRQGYTPPDAAAYALRVPPGTTEQFHANYARVPARRKVRVVRYRVRYGDTVSGIAARLGVNTRAVLDANRIRNPRRLRAGALINIPLRPQYYERAKRWADRRLEELPDPSLYDQITYTVRPGDTLWGIARRQGVSPEQIRAWNRLAASRYIHPGNQLVIWKPRTLAVAGAPGGKEEAVIDDLYTVKRGDTLWDIARAFRTSVSNLKMWNGIRRGSRIRAGSRIRVGPSGAPGNTQ